MTGPHAARDAVQEFPERLAKCIAPPFST